jgi:hypothetical protein
MKLTTLTYMTAIALAAMMSVPLAAQGPQQPPSVATIGTASANPAPFISQPLVPDAKTPGGPGFTLNVSGSGFVLGSAVNWNGSARATTFVSGSELTAKILSSDITTAKTASITVTNPGPGGGISNPVFFEVTRPSVAVSLVKWEDYSTGIGASSVVAADFNSDGKLDLAVANT